MITVPKTFQQLITQDQRLLAMVETTISNAGLLLDKNHLPFFPEYSNHGPEHIQDVLNDAERLVPHNALAVFTKEDAALLVLSVLLHDAGMHIGEDGFFYILNNPEG